MMIALPMALPAPVQYELRFQSLFDAGRAYAFPCDAAGHVDLDALSDRARGNYRRGKQECSKRDGKSETPSLPIGPIGCKPASSKALNRLRSKSATGCPQRNERSKCDTAHAPLRRGRARVLSARIKGVVAHAANGC